MIPISFWGGNLRHGPMDGSTTQNPNASRKPPCWMAACRMPRSWRFGKNQGKGVDNFCPSKKWWETRANTVGFRECIWCNCIFETNIWGLSFAYEILKGDMYDIYAPSFGGAEWLVDFFVNKSCHWPRQKGPFVICEKMPISRRRPPSIFGSFRRVLEVAGHWNESSSSSS